MQNKTNSFKEKHLGSVGFHAATSQANHATNLHPLERVLDYNFTKDFRRKQNFPSACINFNFRSGLTFLGKEDRIDDRVPII